MPAKITPRTLLLLDRAFELLKPDKFMQQKDFLDMLANDKEIQESFRGYNVRQRVASVWSGYRDIRSIKFQQGQIEPISSQHPFMLCINHLSGNPTYAVKTNPNYKAETDSWLHKRDFEGDSDNDGSPSTKRHKTGPLQVPKELQLVFDSQEENRYESYMQAYAIGTNMVVTEPQKAEFLMDWLLWFEEFPEKITPMIQGMNAAVEFRKQLD